MTQVPAHDVNVGDYVVWVHPDTVEALEVCVVHPPERDGEVVGHFVTRKTVAYRNGHVRTPDSEIRAGWDDEKYYLGWQAAVTIVRGQ